MIYNFDEIVRRDGTNSLKYDGRSGYFGVSDILPLWVADMDFKTPDFVMKAIRQRAEHEILGYSIKSEGFDKSVINWMQRRFEWTVKPEWISFTPGVVAAINFAVLGFSEPGDKIIIQPPVYFPFFTAVKDHNRQLVVNQLKNIDGHYTMDLDHLESIIDDKTKLFILCNPHNPVGRVWKRKELEDLGNICVKHKLTVFSDEIHSDIILNGHEHIPFAKVSKEFDNITVTSMAPSKTFNIAGLSSSVAIISNYNLKKKFEHIPKSLHLTGGNIFGNVALEAAYREGEEWLLQMLAYLDKNFRFVKSFINENIKEIKVIDLEGTYLVWLDCTSIKARAGNLNKFFVEKAKTGLSGGNDFGPGGDGFMRLNIGCPLSVLKEALQRIKNAVDKL